ncbi:hypothetical protein LZ30DRAFT_778844 [Colletotrichum cereale]|nr:hypothetical protein LZ30DRAFT_778844 [Colletotrichum cereale]
MAHSKKLEPASKAVSLFAAYHNRNARPREHQRSAVSNLFYGYRQRGLTCGKAHKPPSKIQNTKMVAFRFLLALLPLAAAVPSPNPFEDNSLHCTQPTNCGSAVQNTACDFCCAKDVKPDGKDCKARDNKTCQTSDKKDGLTYNCDAD